MSVSLKVLIVRTGALKTVVFDGSASVGDAIRLIKDKVEEGGSDHGIFLTPTDYAAGKWLENNKTLNFYDLKSGDQVEFKKKHRPLRVMMMDNNVKTVLIDDSAITQDLTAVICEHVNLDNPEEWGLKDPKADENAWLNPSQTLREQGINDTDVIVLKQRFHYTDHNVDTSNPYRLNLLYQQCRDAIVTGKYPCTMDESVQFAAMQAQVVYGDHVPTKHKPGFMPLEEFVPAEYVKEKKKLETRIWAEHRTLSTLSELNAKFRYVQLCRSLKTYGITFFHVKEVATDAKGNKKKGKLVERLLGITRDKIVRLDNDTKQVISSYELRHLRRWAASNNSFTFDFGDYEEAYYSVQTTEGESMSQVIAGYIDIILKRTRDAEKAANDDDDENAVEEETIAPSRGVAKTSTPGRLQAATAVNVGAASSVNAAGRAVGISNTGMSAGRLQGAQVVGGAAAWNGDFARGDGGDLQSFTPANNESLNGAGLNGLLKDLESAFMSVNAACNDLSIPLTQSNMGDDPAAVAWRNQTLQATRQQLRAHANGMTLATAQILAAAVCSDPNDFDADGLANACRALGAHVTQLATLGRAAASLQDDPEECERLLTVCKELSAATKRLVAAANGAAGGLASNIVDPNLRDELLNAAQAIGAQLAALLARAGASEVDANNQAALHDAMTKVTAAAKKLVGESKTTAAAVTGDDNKARVIQAAKVFWTTTSQLLAVSKVVAPTITTPKSLEQLDLSCQSVSGAANRVLGDAKLSAASQESLRGIKGACDELANALRDLLDAAKSAGDRPDYTEEYQKTAQAVSEAARRLEASAGNATKIVENMKATGAAAAAMVKITKAEASSETDPNLKAALNEASKRLMEATSALVNAAKVAAANPDDADAQADLIAKTRALDALCSDAANAAARRVAVRDLVAASKEASAATTQLIQAAKPAAANNSNPQAAQAMIGAAKEAADATTKLVGAVKVQQMSPADSALQGKLITAALAAATPTSKLVQSVKGALATVEDDTAKNNLAGAAKDCSVAMQNLLLALRAAKAVCGGLEFDGAIDQINGAKANLVASANSLAAGRLQPEFGQTPQSTFESLMNGTRGVDSAITAILKAAQDADAASAGIAAKDSGAAMAGLAMATRACAACMIDSDDGAALIQSCQVVALTLMSVVLAAKTSAAAPDDASRVDQVLATVGECKRAMESMSSTLPGQREVESALAAIAAAGDMSQLPAANPARSAKDLQTEFGSHARLLANAQQRLQGPAASSPSELATGANEAAEGMVGIINVARQAAANATDAETRRGIQKATTELTTATCDLLSATGLSAQAPSDPKLAAAVDDASLVVSSSLNDVSNFLQAAGPGQAECNQAQKEIQAAAAAVEIEVSPQYQGKTYLEIHKKFKEASRDLGHATSGCMQIAKADPGDVGATANAVRTSTVMVVQLAAAAASLTSDGGRVTISHFVNPAEDIKDASNAVRMSKGNSKAVVMGLQTIAKSTQVMINASKTAAKQVDDEAVSNQFLALAKEVAAATTATIAAGKTLAQNPSPQTERDTESASRELTGLVATLVKLAEAHLEARTVSAAQTACRNKITAGAKGLASEVNQMLSAVKLVAANGKDVKARQQMAMASKGITSELANLQEALIEGAPGAAECDAAVGAVSSAIGDIDSATMSASLDDLKAEAGQTVESTAAELLEATKRLSHSVVRTVDAGRSKPHELGSAAAGLAAVMPDFASGAVGVAATESDPVRRVELLGLAKSVCETTLELVVVSKEVGGDSEEMEGQMRLDQASNDVSTAIGALIAELRGAMEGSAEINDAAASIDRLTKGILTLKGITPSGSAADCNNNLAKLAKSYAAGISKLASSAKAQPDKVGPLCTKIAEVYPQLVEAAKEAAVAASDVAARDQLLKATGDVGASTVELLTAVSALSTDKKSFQKQQAVANAARVANVDVTKLISATKSKSAAVRSCENSLEAVAGAVHDLESASMFASMGQLEREAGTYDAHHEAIVAAAAALRTHNTTMAQSAAANGDALAAAATAAGEQVSNIVAAAKAGASVLGEKQLQANVFEASSDVANKTSTVLSLAINVSGTAGSDAAQNNALLDASAALAAALTALTNTSATAKQANGMGLAAVEAAIANITAALSAYTRSKVATIKADVAEMVDTAKRVATSASSIVSAVRTTPSALAAAAEGIDENNATLLDQSKACAADCEDAEAKAECYAACTAVAQASTALLNVIKGCNGYSKDAAIAKALADRSKDVAMAVSKVVESASSLRSDYYDPNDPNAVAERELLAAAASIEAAAKKLATLQPKPPVNAPNMDLAFNEQILEAAKAIAAATGALVKSATLAQRELVAAGKAGSKDPSEVYHVDPKWQEGLVSAAKAVAGSTNQLCSAANDAANGVASEDALIAAANGVAANTAHLVAAARAKATDPNSKSQVNLKNAAKSVKTATASLVESAKAFTQAQEEMNNNTNVMMAANELTDMERIRLETEARARVLKLERELQAAQASVSDLHKGRYAGDSGRAAAPPPKPAGRPGVAPPAVATESSSTVDTASPSGAAGLRKAPPPKPAMSASSSASSSSSGGGVASPSGAGAGKTFGSPASSTAGEGASSSSSSSSSSSTPAAGASTTPPPKPSVVARGTPPAKPAVPAPSAAASASTSSGGGRSGAAAGAATTYTLEELVARTGLPPTVDQTQLENYLSDADFATVFSGASRADVAAMPAWKRTNIKKKANLY